MLCVESPPRILDALLVCLFSAPVKEDEQFQIPRSLLFVLGYSTEDTTGDSSVTSTA